MVVDTETVMNPMPYEPNVMNLTRAFSPLLSLTVHVSNRDHYGTLHMTQFLKDTTWTLVATQIHKLLLFWKDQQFILKGIDYLFQI